MLSMEKTNMLGLLWHSSAKVSTMSRESVLKKKFDKGDITTEELREYASLLAVTKAKPKQSYIITVWGKLIEVTKEEYENHCKGF